MLSRASAANGGEGVPAGGAIVTCSLAIVRNVRPSRRAGYPTRMRDVRAYDVRLWLARVAALVGLLLSLSGIYALTEQSVDGTSALSSSVGTAAERVVSRVEELVFPGDSVVDASAPAPVAEDLAPRAASAPAADAVHEEAPAQAYAQTAVPRTPGPLALYVRENVRRLAHVAEFASVGLFSALTAVLWLGIRRRPEAAWGTRRLIAVTLLFCVASSLFDQTHKLFVPGRHFDVLDLTFDAAGYLMGVVAVFGVRALVRRGVRGSEAHVAVTGGASS